MNKNKILLGLGTTVAVATPIVAVVSCGGVKTYQGRYDSENNRKLKITHSFSVSGPQAKALKLVVDEWNKIAAKDKTKMPIELARIEGGYSAFSTTFAQSFEAGDKKKTPNAFIGYPDTLGTLVKYDMQEPLADKNSDVQGLFGEDFVKINNQIGGIDKGGFYAAPIAKSVDMQAINMPVMKHIMTELGYDLSATDLAPITAEGGDIWGKASHEFTDDQKSKYSLANITSNYETLFDFIAKVVPLFKGKQKDAYILGVDSATNLFYSMVSQMVDSKDEDFLFSKGDDGYIQYNWDNKNSPSYKAFAKAYGSFKKAVDAHGVYINVGGAYSSNLEVEHRIAIAYGSTAGYKYDFLDGKPVPVLDDGSKLTSHTDKLTASSVGGVVATFGSYNNKIYKSTYKGDVSGYDVQLKDAAADKFFDANIGKELYISSDSKASNAKIKAQATEGKYAKYLVVAPKVSTAEHTLQENELAIQALPGKFDKTKDEAYLVQGPSLIGVHTNKEEDAAFKTFFEWFMKGDSITVNTGNGDSKDDVKGKPYEVFANIAGYLVPTKNALTTTPANLNRAQKLTFETLKKIQDNNSIHAFDNPVDDTTGKFRTTLQSTLAAQYTSIHAGESTKSASDIYKAVSRDL